MMTTWLRSLQRAAVRRIGGPRVDEREFRQWRKTSLDPAIRSGAWYVPMPGLERARYYRDKQNRHHLGRYEWAVRVLAPTRPVRVLDAACGAGYGTAMLARISGHVHGIDVSEAVLRLAQFRYNRSNVIWHRVDVSELRHLFEPGSFDAIVSFQTIECIEDDRRFLEDLHELLKPGGQLLIDTPTRKHRISDPENPHHRRHYGTQEWLDMLVEHFGRVDAFDSLPEVKMLERLGMPSRGSIARCAKRCES